MRIERFKEFYKLSKIVWSAHGVQRLQECDISISDVGKCIMNGEIIEEYNEEAPAKSSALIYGKVNGKVLHIVLGIDEEQIYFVTGYIPDKSKFNDDLRTRRK